jgi:tetratricopeptide (TPR) repeat protein
VAGKYDEVIREARKALEQNERSVPPMAAMAEAYFHKKEYELCRAVLDSINEQQKEHPLYLYLRGRMFIIEGNFSLAQAFFEKAVEKNPSLLDAWTVIGVRRLQGGSYQRALEALLRAKALPGGNTYAMNLNIGSCYRGLAHQGGGAEQFQAALNYYTEAERLFSQDPGNSGKAYLMAIYNKAILHLDAQTFPGLTNIQRLERGILFMEQYVTLAPRLDPKAWAAERADVLKILTKAKTVDLPAAKAGGQARPVQPQPPPAPPAPPPERESPPARPAPPPERDPPPARPAPPPERDPPPARPAPPPERESPPARPVQPPPEEPPTRPAPPPEPPPR